MTRLPVRTVCAGSKTIFVQKAPELHLNQIEPPLTIGQEQPEPRLQVPG